MDAFPEEPIVFFLLNGSISNCSPYEVQEFSLVAFELVLIAYWSLSPFPGELIYFCQVVRIVLISHVVLEIFDYSIKVASDVCWKLGKGVTDLWFTVLDDAFTFCRRACNLAVGAEVVVIFEEMDEL